MAPLAETTLSVAQVGTIVVIVGGAVLGLTGYLIRWGLANLLKSFQVVLDGHASSMAAIKVQVDDNHKETLGRLELLENQLVEQRLSVTKLKAQHDVFHSLPSK